MPKLSCHNQLLKYLTRRGHGVKEVAGKLKEKGYPGHEIAEAITRAEESGFLDDEKFAEDCVRYRAEISKWGPNKIKQELKQKGIAESYINQAFDGYEFPIFAGAENPDADIEEDWKAQALGILTRKYKAWPEDCRQIAANRQASSEDAFEQRNRLEKEKAKRLNFLLRRGFTSTQARYALNKTLDDLQE